MYWLSLILLIAFKLLLAGKDATSYLLKDNSKNDDLTHHRLDRWHRDGVAIDALFTLVLSWATGLWILTPIQSLLSRLGFYDPAFNKWSSLDINYIGNTSKADLFFRKIFGEHGAVKKSLIFLIALVVWGLIKTFV